MDIPTRELAKPRPQARRGRRPAKKWVDNSDKITEVPVHLFTSPAHSQKSSSSSSSRVSEPRRGQSRYKETSFSPVQNVTVEIEKNVPRSDDEGSSPHGYTSSEVDDISSPTRVKPRRREIPQLRTNKIHDLSTQEEGSEAKTSRSRVTLKSARSAREDVSFDLSVRRQSADDSSGDQDLNRSATPMSTIESRSYRDRLRDRFNTLKERAVESLSRPQSRSQSRIKQLMLKQSGTTIMEDVLRQEEENVAAAMEKHQKMKQLWKQLSLEVLKKKTIPDEEGFDFFTRCYDNDDDIQDMSSPPRVPPGEELVQVVIHDSRSSTVSPTEPHVELKVTTSEYLGISHDWELVEVRPPTIEDEKEVRKKREEILFYPSTKTVPLKDKLAPNMQPRYLEDEGLYVGNKIRVSSRNRNKMEQRLIASENGRIWFNEDGEIKSQPDPVRKIPTKPQLNEDAVNDQVLFQPATISDLKHMYMDLSSTSHYVIDIHLNWIMFTHHALFSREHVLAQRLKELYVTYKRRQSTNNETRLNGRLEALRRARDNLLKVVDESGNSTLEKLYWYENDIKEAREMRLTNAEQNRQLVNKILTTWKDLKQLRQNQGYQSTLIKLSIKKHTREDLEDERIRWDENIKQEAEEIINEMERDYEKKMLEYEVLLELWRRKERKKQERKTPMRRKNRELSKSGDDEISGTESGDTDSEHQGANDSDDELPKPEKPIKPNVTNVLEDVSERFSKCFRHPGEPEIELSINYSKTGLDSGVINSKEEQRRNAVKKCGIFVKLFYNDKEVCKTRTQQLTNKFHVTLGQRFAIRILEWPVSLMFEIYEDNGTLSKSLLASEIYIPFPEQHATLDNSNVEKFEFSSAQVIRYNHAGVGCGINFTPFPDGSVFNNEPVYLHTSGMVSCRIGWGVDDHGNVLAPPEKYWSNHKYKTNIVDIFSASGGKFDVNKLKSWTEESKLDPNDPINAAFFYYLQTACETMKNAPKCFRLDALQTEYDWCTDEDLETNRRLKLLKLRDAGEPEFRGMRMIPNSEKEIRKDIFKSYEKRVSTPHTMLDVSSTDPLDGHRTWGRKYLQEVQERILKQCRQARQQKRLHDVVTEDHVPDIGTLGLTFMKWLRPRRPLRPIRKERKKITVDNLLGQEIKIVVNVVGAFEVPIRKDVDGININNNSLDGFSLVNVKPFVEISFKGMTTRTTSAEGANPTWNQNLILPIRTNNGDFSPGNIQSVKDVLYLHLFDEIVVDLIEDDRIRETNIHQRLERHWLGSLQIPFSTLYFNSRIEGTFKLYTPPVLLGYEREAYRGHGNSNTNQEPMLTQRDATFITLFITVQPALNPPEPFKERLESSETATLEKHFETWLEQVSILVPHRKQKTLVTDITGKSVCVTRYIRPLAPPVVAEDVETTPEMAARYVAMIPTCSGSNFLPSLFDIWMTGDQVLRLLSGGTEDHAVLLCCYFLHLGLRAYVLLGSGIPHGLTAYVLVKETVGKVVEYHVWDANSGQKYNVTDSFCPLQKVYSILSEDNIYANIQLEELPRRTLFDINKKNDWLPVFGRNFGSPVGSVQPSSVEYRTTSRQSVQILQDKMENKLRDNLMKWRKTKRTQWNRYCAATLRKLLQKLERCTWKIEDGATPDHVQELQHILSSHKMCGFPMNMAYTTMDAVLEAVKATGVHCNECPGVEFALAVYLHPYPNDVLSVWIYVASLVKRN